MKRIVAVLVLALAVAAAVWVAMRFQRAHQGAVVAELLPRTTLALAQVPDFGRSREQWHTSDVYKIWSEPAVQAWLQKPLANIRAANRGRRTAEDFLALHPTDGFLALTSISNNEPKLSGGFHFEGSAQRVREFLEPRLAKWLPKADQTKRATITYRDHQIETMTFSCLVLATAIDSNWFLASNDLASLKALLDRVERRGVRNGDSLAHQDFYMAATRYLPADLAGMFLVDPQPFIDKLLPLVAMTGQAMPPEQVQRLKQVRSVAVTIGFDQGKMREALFVGMPQVKAPLKLGRPSLGTASSETFLYSASVTHWAEKWLPAGFSGGAFPPTLQEFANALRDHGVSAADLQQAFADELELIGEWPSAARWPVAFATLAVKDVARAGKIVDALTSVQLAGATWARSEKAGVAYYSVQPFGGFVPLSPVIALSHKLLVAGSDAAAVEATMTRTTDPARALERSATYREAATRVPEPDSAFTYIDTRLLFERADAALRPLLLMSATFYPALGKSVDTATLPPPEAIAKHLSPIVMSQRYVTDGYLTESVGPITFNEATIGLVGGIGAGFVWLQKGHHPAGLGSPTPSLPAAPPFANPSAAATATPP